MTFFQLHDRQRLEAAGFIAGWLEKASVGCLIVGLFQPAHMTGGVIGAAFFFATAFVLKIRGIR